jgi:hypothetical protein
VLRLHPCCLDGFISCKAIFQTQRRGEKTQCSLYARSVGKSRCHDPFTHACFICHFRPPVPLLQTPRHIMTRFGYLKVVSVERKIFVKKRGGKRVVAMGLCNYNVIHRVAVITSSDSSCFAFEVFQMSIPRHQNFPRLPPAALHVADHSVAHLLPA